MGGYGFHRRDEKEWGQADWLSGVIAWLSVVRTILFRLCFFNSSSQPVRPAMIWRFIDSLICGLCPGRSLFLGVARLLASARSKRAPALVRLLVEGESGLLIVVGKRPFSWAPTAIQTQDGGNRR